MTPLRQVLSILAWLIPGALQAAITLTNVTVSGNGGPGVRVNAPAATLTGQGIIVTGNSGGGVLVSAGRANLSGATQINGNHGGGPVSFGAQVAPGAVMTITGVSGTPVRINTNDGVGLLVRGNFSGTYVETANNGIHGVWVATTDAPLFPEGGTPTQNAVLVAFDIHGNGTNPGSYRPGGLTVLRTRTSTTSMTTPFNFYAPERFLLAHGPLVGEASQIHDNLGDGVTLGGDPTPTTGLCASLPASLSCGAVDASVQSSDIFGNQEGIVIQQQDSNQNATVPVLFGNQITRNAGVGLHVHTSYVGMDWGGARISGNLIGSNGWAAGAACTANAEGASQILFEGPVAATAAVVSACAAHDDTQVTACNADRANACIFNQFAPANKCRTAYDLGSLGCRDSGANGITGYDRLGIENEDFRVGIVVKDGAWVGAINASFLTTSFQQGLDWVAIGADSFASNADTVCAAVSNKCP